MEDGTDILDADRGHGLEIVLEEAYGWAVVTGARLKNMVDGWRGRRGSHPEQRQAQAYEFELDGEATR